VIQRNPKAVAQPTPNMVPTPPPPNPMPMPEMAPPVVPPVPPGITSEDGHPGGWSVADCFVRGDWPQSPKGFSESPLPIYGIIAPRFPRRSGGCRTRLRGVKRCPMKFRDEKFRRTSAFSTVYSSIVERRAQYLFKDPGVFGAPRDFHIIFRWRDRARSHRHRKHCWVFRKIEVPAQGLSRCRSAASLPTFENKKPPRW